MKLVFQNNAHNYLFKKIRIRSSKEFGKFAQLLDIFFVRVSELDRTFAIGNYDGNPLNDIFRKTTGQ